MRRHLPSVEGLNQNDAARVAGMHVDTFRKLSQSDFPPPKNANGFYELEHLGEWLRAKTVRDKVQPALDAGAAKLKLDPSQERARKDREMANRLELENKVRRSELIEVATVEAAAIDVVLRVRARLLRLPADMAHQVSGLEDRIDIQELLDSAVREALEELSKSWTE